MKLASCNIQFEKGEDGVLITFDTPDASVLADFP